MNSTGEKQSVDVRLVDLGCMRRPWLVGLAVAGCLSALSLMPALVAVAQKPGASEASGTAAGGEPASTTYSFDDDLVTGDLVRPDGELLRVRRRGRQSSLIRVREHFIPELVESVEQL